MSNIILCADDSKTMQTVAEITFRVSDYQYVGAMSADEALDKARAQKPALILADAVMPGKTGYDLCKMVKGDPQLADVPVIMLCGNSEAYDADRGAAVGADGHLPKPWDSQVMLDKVAELVSKGASQPAAALPVSQPSISKIKPPTLGAPNVPNLANPASMGKSKDPAGARTHTIMGMPTIQPPLPAAATPAAPPTPPAPITPPTPVIPARAKTAPPKPATLKPAMPPKPVLPQTPGIPKRPSTVPSKYAPPSMKSAITKPGIPDPPKPALQPEVEHRPTKAMPAALTPAAPPRTAAAEPPVVAPRPVVPAPPTIAPVAEPAPVAAPPRPAPPPLRPVAEAAPAVAAQATSTPSAALPLGRPPMIRGIPTRQPPFIAPAALRQVDVARVTHAAVAHAAAQVGIAADGPEVKALLALSHDVVERMLWEIVPPLAEAIIRENLGTLTAKR